MSSVFYIPLSLFGIAFVACIVYLLGKCPLWLPVLFFCMLGVTIQVIETHVGRH